MKPCLPIFSLGLSLLAVAPVGAQAWTKSPISGHYYQMTSSRMTWKDAEKAAQSAGGHLVTIRSQAENDWVYNTFAKGLTTMGDSLWIGYTDESKEGSWIWSGGDPMGFENWDTKEPNNAGGVEHFACMYGSVSAHAAQSRWNDVPNLPPGFASGYYGLMEAKRTSASCEVHHVWQGVPRHEPKGPASWRVCAPVTWQ